MLDSYYMGKKYGVQGLQEEFACGRITLECFESALEYAISAEEPSILSDPIPIDPLPKTVIDPLPDDLVTLNCAIHGLHSKGYKNDYLCLECRAKLDSEC